MLKVTKFGGSSVAGAARFEQVKRIIEADDARRVVVISAAGKRTSDDHKLTDLLYLCHAHLSYGVSCEDILADIRARLVEIQKSLGLEFQVGTEFDAFAAKLTKDTPVDYLVSRGEYFTSRLMAEYLGFSFVDAADCIFFGMDGHLNKEKTYQTIQNFAARYGKIVVPGFYGSLPNGRIKAMSRGGSDVTGSILAAALKADVYENWTDVPGIAMADPKIVPAPQTIRKLTFDELQELAFMGASVLNEDSVQPVREKGIPINIRSTKEPENPGTLIVDCDNGENAVVDEERFITGIAGRKNFSILTIQKHQMLFSETLRRSLEVFDRMHVPVEHITLGYDSFALVFSSATMGDGLYDAIADIEKAVHPDDLRLEDHVALIAAVGRKMTSRPGVSGRLFGALGAHNINIRIIDQGADELSIIVGVADEQFEEAIRVLYSGFAG